MNIFPHFFLISWTMPEGLWSLNETNLDGYLLTKPNKFWLHFS